MHCPLFRPLLLPNESSLDQVTACSPPVPQIPSIQNMSSPFSFGLNTFIATKLDVDVVKKGIDGSSDMHLDSLLHSLFSLCTSATSSADNESIEKVMAGVVGIMLGQYSRALSTLLTSPINSSSSVTSSNNTDNGNRSLMHVDSVAVLLGIFMEMLEYSAPPVPESISSSTAIGDRLKQCAFELIHCLFVHADIIAPSISPSVSSSPSAALVRRDVMGKFCEMTEWCVHRFICSTSVWPCITRIFLHLISVFKHSNSVNHEVYVFLCERMDVACVKMMFDCGVNENVYNSQHLLCQTLLTKLYSRDSKLLPDAVDRVGGIGWVLDKYVSAHSQSSRRSLFRVIYDYAIWDLSDRRNMQIPAAEVNGILGLLETLGSGEYMVSVFRHVPERFVEGFVRFLYIEVLRKDPVLMNNFGNLDKSVLVAVLYHLESIAKSRTGVKQELRSLLHHAEREVDIEPTILDLLGSRHADERRQSVNMLFKLWKRDMDSTMNGGPDESMSLQDLTALSTLIMDKFVQSADPIQRSAYYDIIIRLIADSRFSMMGGGEDSTSMSSLEAKRNQLFGEVNVSLVKMVKSLAANQSTVTSSEFASIVNHVILPLVCIPVAHSSNKECTSMSHGLSNDTYSLINEVVYLLDMKTIGRLFIVMLGCGTAVEDFDLGAVLLLISCQAKFFGADRVGGMSFFKKLIASDRRLVAHVASSYLLDQLATEKPEQFHMLVGKLSQKLNTTTENFLNDPFNALQTIMNLRSHSQQE